jgi:hypothetical protein
LIRIKQNLSAIAAVDQAGQLVEVFSLDDMVGITDSMTISCLWNNIAFFKDQIRRQVGKIKTKKKVCSIRRRPITGSQFFPCRASYCSSKHHVRASFAADGRPKSSSRVNIFFLVAASLL